MNRRNHILLFYPRFNTGISSPSPEGLPIPMPILFVAAPLIKEGFEITLLDGRVEDYRATVFRLKDELLVCGISCLISQVKQGLEFSLFVKEIEPRIKIVWGGWYPSIFPDLTIANRAIDFVVRGEGEKTFTELCLSIRDGEDVASIKGVTFRENGEVFSNPDRLPEKDFPGARLPHDLLRLNAYDAADGSISFLSSRGCNQNCAFCAVGKYSGPWRGMDAEHVVSELALLKSRFGVRRFIFLDDSFFADPERVKNIAKLLIDARLDINWICNGHLSVLKTVDDETLGLARVAGLELLTMGVESGAQETLNLIRKGYEAENLFPILDQIHTAEIPFCLNFMVGLPEENLSALEETFSLMESIIQKYPISTFRLFLYHPIPGTALYDYERATNTSIPYPESLEEAGMFRTYPHNPWHPSILDHTGYADRDFIRKKSFYFRLAHPSHFGGKNNRTGLLRHLWAMIQRLADFRYKKNAFAVPFEWWAYKGLFLLKDI